VVNDVGYPAANRYIRWQTFFDFGDGQVKNNKKIYLSVYPRFTPFLGTDLILGPTPDPSITGNGSYTRANFLYYAGVVEPGRYR
jgi:hypothetical protein